MMSGFPCTNSASQRCLLSSCTDGEIAHLEQRTTIDEDFVDVEESAKYPSAPWMVRISGSHLLRLDGVDFHAFQASEPVKSISLSKVSRVSNGSIRN